MLAAWAAAGQPPTVFWLPGFFFVQSFFTAGGCRVKLADWQHAGWHGLLQQRLSDSPLLSVFCICRCCCCCCCLQTAGLQNYARKHGIPIDAVAYDFEMMGTDAAAQRSQPAPSEGMYVEGLFLEGAGWDAASKQLAESQPGVLFVPAPVMWFRPRQTADGAAGGAAAALQQHYSCPMYRTADRRGVLATTGHSTNFVMFVRLPSREPAEHWTMRGVALLTQLAD
jgi:dynein heavy chain